MATCSTDGSCYVRNDRPFDTEAHVRVSVVHFATGAVETSTEFDIALDAGAGTLAYFCALNASAAAGAVVAAHKAASRARRTPTLPACLSAPRGRRTAC